MIEIVEFPKVCIYCPNPIEKGRGEHIVPKIIGGAVALGDISDRNVCSRCNSGLSDIDRELCCRSHLAIVASQELESETYQAWDVDHKSYNLLVEAKPDWHPSGVLNSLYCYPQVILTPRGLQFRGDAEEMSRFGLVDFELVMRKVVRRVYNEYRSGNERTLHLEKIHTDTIHNGYWLPPRVFTRRTIWEIAKKAHKQSLILRFGTEKDKIRGLCAMSEMTAERQFDRWGQYQGSRVPTIATYFDVGDALRGMLKIALNLVTAYCRNTPVNHTTFDKVMRIILREGHPHTDILDAMGFTKASDIQFIAVPGAHSFRLLYAGGHWQVLSSYFGGRIGTFVAIPGPNNERWACADIVAPIRSNKWSFKVRDLSEAIMVRTQWQNVREIAPSLLFQHTKWDTKVELAPKKRRLLTNGLVRAISFSSPLRRRCACCIV